MSTLNITSATLAAASKRLLYAGDDYDYTFILTYGGSPINLTGSTVWFSVKGDKDDADTDALLRYISTDPTRLQITDAAAGTFVLHFKAADTLSLDGTWPYDVKFQDAAGDVTHAVEGDIEFLSPVTRGLPTDLTGTGDLDVPEQSDDVTIGSRFGILRSDTEIGDDQIITTGIDVEQTNIDAWAVVDAFSPDCEIKHVTGGADGLFDLESSLTKAHSQRALIDWTVLPVFNVKLFRAKGDGSTDDTTAILAAIAEAEAADGGIVYFPAGNYLYNSNLEIPGGILLKGQGIYATTLRPMAGVTAAIALHDVSRVEDLGLFGALTSGAIGVRVGIDIDTMPGLSRVWIQGFTGANAVGLQIYRCILTRFTEVYVKANQTNIFLGGDGTSLPTTTKFYNCETRDAIEYGLRVSASWQAGFYGCGFESNAQAVYLDASDTVQGIYFDDGCWWESNSGSYNIECDSGWVGLRNSFFNGSSPKAIRAYGTASVVLDNVQMDGVAGQVVLEDSAWCHFRNSPRSYTPESVTTVSDNAYIMTDGIEWQGAPPASGVHYPGDRVRNIDQVTYPGVESWYNTATANPGNWLPSYINSDPQLSLRYFGAKGDGSNATDAFLAAFAADIPVIYVPAGIYEISANLVPPVGTRIIGNRSLSIIRPTAAVTIAMTITDETDVRGLVFDGQYTDGALGVLAGTSTDAAITMRDCIVQSFGGTGALGLKVASCIGPRFDNLFIASNTRGMLIDGAPSLPTIPQFTNCTFQSNVDEGAVVSNAYVATFRSCVFQASGKEGLVLTTACTGIILDNCWFETNLLASGTHQLRAASTSEFTARSSIFVGSSAIRVEDGCTFVIDDCSIPGNAADISIEGTSTGYILNPKDNYNATSVSIAGTATVKNHLPWVSWNSWIPTITASGSMTVTNVSITSARYRIENGRTIHMCLSFTCTLGGVPSTEVWATFPGAIRAYDDNFFCTCYVTEGDGVFGGGFCSPQNSANKIKFFAGDGGPFALGAAADIRFVGTFEIA